MDHRDAGNSLPDKTVLIPLRLFLFLFDLVLLVLCIDLSVQKSWADTSVDNLTGKK